MNLINSLFCKIFHQQHHREVERNYNNKGRQIIMECLNCFNVWEE